MITRLFISVLICMSLPVMAVAAEESPAASMVVQMPGGKEGRTFLASVLEKFQGMQAYQFESSLTCYEKAKAVTDTGRFFYKNPGLIRFEAVSAGSKSGSVVVRQADGKIRAKSRFIPVVVDLPPQSKLLQTRNGYNIVESDFSTLIASLLKSLQGNLKCVVTGSPVPYPGLERAYVLEVMRDPNIVVQRIALNADSKLPVEWSLYKDDKLWSVLRIQKLSATIPAGNLFSFDGRDSGQKSLESRIADRILTAVSAPGANSGVSLPLLKDAKSALAALKRQCGSIEQSADAHLLLQASSAKGVTAGTASGALQQSNNTALKSLSTNILADTATIEWLAYSLSKLEKGVKTLDMQAEPGEKSGNAGKKRQSPVALSRQWHENLAAINQRTSKLCDLLEADLPDMKAVALEARKMQSNDQVLESIVEQLLTKI